MSISLSHSRLLAIVLVVVAALSLGLTTPAFAQFAQGDLTGNWTLHGLITANAEGATTVLLEAAHLAYISPGSSAGAGQPLQLDDPGLGAAVAYAASRSGPRALVCYAPASLADGELDG